MLTASPGPVSGLPGLGGIERLRISYINLRKTLRDIERRLPECREPTQRELRQAYDTVLRLRSQVLAALREDGRGRRILLTEEGNGALVRIIGALDRRERAVLRRFGEENARRLIALTELFNRCFAEEEE